MWMWIWNVPKKGGARKGTFCVNLNQRILLLGGRAFGPFLGPPPILVFLAVFICMIYRFINPGERFLIWFWVVFDMNVESEKGQKWGFARKARNPENAISVRNFCAARARQVFGVSGIWRENIIFYLINIFFINFFINIFIFYINYFMKC
jgi:hypothetical protein